MFSKREDSWNIHSAVKEIYTSARLNARLSVGLIRKFSHQESDLFFDAFFNQWVPDIYKASRESVIRHRKQIETLAIQYREGELWIKRNNQLKCVAVNHELFSQIIANNPSIQLPTYIEIEQEKTKWQQAPRYRYPERTQALEEEYVQLKITKGGDNEKTIVNNRQKRS